MRSLFVVRARGHARLRLTVAAATAIVAACLTPSTAQAADVVNTTFHVPASVMTNPCFPADVLNLSGDIHVVITTTADGTGGFHTVNTLNSQLSGASITSGLKYVSSEESSDDWYARPPYPEIHTHTYDFDVNSQTGVDNYVMHITMHETVTANGIPAAQVDQYQMDCRG
jgi:hypothetical protein